MLKDNFHSCDWGIGKGGGVSIREEMNYSVLGVLGAFYLEGKYTFFWHGQERCRVYSSEQILWLVIKIQRKRDKLPTITFNTYILLRKYTKLDDIHLWCAVLMVINIIERDKNCHNYLQYLHIFTEIYKGRWLYTSLVWFAVHCGRLYTYKERESESKTQKHAI